MPSQERDRAALRWVEHVTGTNVRRSVRLPGGMSSLVRRCELGDGSTVVLRQIDNEAWRAEDPDAIDREQRVLELLAVPAAEHELRPFVVPRHLGSDADAGLLLMSWLPGETVTQAVRLRSNIDLIAQVHSAIGGVALPADHGLPAWQSWCPPAVEPPPWGDRTLWLDAIAAHRALGQPTVDVPVLLHRDLHPLNLLWTGGSERNESVGVVDWINACVGHPDAELAHARWNVAVLVDVDAADELTERCRQHRSDRAERSPWWDLDDVLGLLPDAVDGAVWRETGRPDLSDDRVAGATEWYLRSIVARL